jgi:hypothetical protein
MSRRPYAGALATVLRGAAVPYGYTVTVWTSGMMLSRHRGLPTTGDIFLFMAGAITAFGCLAAVVHLAGGVAFEPSRGALRRIGAAHFLAAGAALGSVALVALVPSFVAWPLGAFAATCVYLSVATAVLTVADRL